MSSQTHGYAQALFEIARAEGNLTRVADELFRIARTLEREHELRQTLTDIAVPSQAKEELLTKLLGGKASDHTVNVIKFVVGQGRGRELVEIADDLARIAEQESNKEIAVVRTAVRLSDEQTKKLGSALERATGKHVSVKVVIDPSVMGGVHARVGDVVIDGTVRHKIELLKEYVGAANV